MSASKMAAHNQAGRRSSSRTAGSTVADLANSAEAFVELAEDDMIQRFVILAAREHAGQGRAEVGFVNGNDGGAEGEIN